MPGHKGLMRIVCALLFVTAACLAPWANACECITYGACHRLELTDTFFVGKALSKAVIEPRFKGQWRQRAYSFVVVESFSGGHRAGDVVTVLTGMGGGDCGIGFEIGERYLVDATVNGKELYTGICSVTGHERRKMAAIRQLRAIVSGGRVADLSGRIAIESNDAYAISGSSKSLSATLVLAEPRKGGERYEAATDADGIYTFERLPAGEYNVKPELTSRYTTRRSADDVIEQEPTIKVPEGGELGAACELSVYVYPTGRIPGQVVDADGRGVPGTVFVYPSPSEAPLERHQWASGATAGSDGRFVVAGLREGSYQLAFQWEPPFDGNWANKKALKTFYYPGAPRLESGMRIDVPDGGASKPVRFVLPEDFQK